MIWIGDWRLEFVMKRFAVLAFLALCFSSLAVSQPGELNAYGLRVVNEAAKYRELVAQNPNMELVDLRTLLKNSIFDIRYASENNFTGKIVYPSAGAYLCKPAAEALILAEADLAGLGIGLKILDAYRPYQATIKFWEIVQNPDYVADPKLGSRHNRGCAVDVSLILLADSLELEMPTPFDDFTKKAASDFPDLSPQVLKNRLLLKTTLEKYGFSQLSSEWWHFDYKSWKAYPVLDIPFDLLPAQNVPKN